MTLEEILKVIDDRIKSMIQVNEIAEKYNLTKTYTNCEIAELVCLKTIFENKFKEEK